MKNLIYVAAACLAVAACNKEVPQLGQNERVDLSIQINGLEKPFTKVTNVSSDSESAVNNVQLFVCDESGIVEAYATSTGSLVNASVSTGSKDIYAIVNAPSLAQVRTKDELITRQSSLGDNSVGSLVMSGSLLNEAISSSTTRKVITVKRLVSKVILQSIKRQFTNNELGGKELKFRGIYLTDVVSNKCYFDGGVEYSWYNKLQYNPNDHNELLHDTVTSTLAQGSTYSTVHSFYPYPNSCDDEPKGAAAGTWSERRTMLVIDTTLDGQDNYYPVYLPALESNKTYIITSFTLTKRGSKHPWEPVESSDVSFEIKVADWENGATYTETI